MRADWYWVRRGAPLQDPGRYVGRLDLPIVPPDRAIARRLKTRLPQGAVWLTSPLERARATVEVLDPSANAVVVADLTDQDLGNWEGRRRTEVHKANPQIEWANPSLVEPEGGEGMRAVVDRTAELIERLVRHYPDRPIVAVSHVALIRAAVLLALDLPIDAATQIDVSPFSLTHLSWSGPNELEKSSDERIGTWHAHSINQTFLP
jgi:broad specificity phosphatase PhoE